MLKKVNMHSTDFKSFRRIFILLILAFLAIFSFCTSKAEYKLMPYPEKHSSAVALAFEIEDASHGDILKAKEFLEENKINATFFVVAGYYEEKANNIAMLNDFEIAAKAWNQRAWKKAVESDDEKSIEENIKLAKQWFEKNGIAVVGFRAPYLMKHESMHDFLEKYGFYYDSSEVGSRIYRKNNIYELQLSIAYDAFWDENTEKFLPVFYYIFSKKARNSEPFIFYTYPRNFDKLQKFIDYAKAKNAWITSYGELLSWIEARDSTEIIAKGDSLIIKNHGNKALRGAYLRAGDRIIKLPEIKPKSEVRLRIE